MIRALGKFIVFLIVICAAVHAASFDCSKARRGYEALICANEELTKADDVLSDAYRRAYDALSSSGSDKEVKKARQRLQKEQHAWIKTRLSECPSVECLRMEYQSRLATLEAYVPHEAAPVPQPSVSRPVIQAPPSRSASADHVLLPGIVVHESRYAAVATAEADPGTSARHSSARGTVPRETLPRETVPRESRAVVQTEVLASVKEAADRELTRALDYLNQVPNYGRRAFVTEMQDRLATALDWDNIDEIKAKTAALAVANQDLDQIVQHQTSQDLKLGPAAVRVGLLTRHSLPQTPPGFWLAASQYWTIVVFSLLGLDWLYCLSKGFQNHCAAPLW